ncbi:MAG: YfhO family protein [Bacteroidales bacterium]
MKDLNVKKILPHLVAIAIFIAITMVYFSPLMEGKHLNQSDNQQYQGASKEIADYRAETGKEALWTNSMFGGMPAYQISVMYSSNMVKYFDHILHLGMPGQSGMVFLYFLGFYILLLAFKVDQKLSTIGAIGFGFSSFFFIILAVGHNTQAIAIGYMAPVVAGVILSFRGKYIGGGILTALALALEIYANHVQITYYLMLILFILIIVEFINKFKEKKLKEFFKVIVIIAGAGILAVGVNFTNLWSTYEYGKASTRSKSELSSNAADKTTGLDRSYVTDYSYGKMETFTLLIPNFFGGSSEGELGKSSDTYKILQQNNVPNPEKITKHLPLYWGPQDFVYGPVYAGAILCFLFVLGLFIVKGKYKWWLLVATVLGIMLAWGKNLMWFTNIFLDYIPGYDKFRAVSMTMVIAEFCIPLLGLLALKNMFSSEITKETKVKALKYSSIITLGVIVLFGFLGSMFFDFISSNDKELASAGYPDWLVSAIQSDRHGLLLADSFRSLILIALVAVGLWLYTINKFKNKNILIIGIGLLILVDMWTVDKRMLNADNFVSKTKFTAEFIKTKCDEAILSDNSLDYRVLNLENPFNDARTSYYHKSIGGYHGAKMKRYQELIENCIAGELRLIQTAFSSKSPDSALMITLKHLPVLDMMNTKYLIYNPQAPPLPNRYALGNAWFVNHYKIVPNADAEIEAMKDFNPSQTAIIDKRYESMVSNYKNRKDTSSSITLSSYTPNDLVYNVKTSKEQLAVFSEIYYDKGWNAYIDGASTPAPYFRTNYVLRGMVVPAGTHKIEWKFEPKVYYTGEKVSYTFNILLILVVVGGLVIELLGGNKKKTADVA